MNNNYDSLKLSLVNFFVKEGFKPSKKFDSSDISFLYLDKASTEFNFIIIFKENYEIKSGVLNNVKSYFKLPERAKISCLYIQLSQSKSNIINDKNKSDVHIEVSSIEDAKFKISSYFKNISKLKNLPSKTKEVEDQGEISNEDIIKILTDPEKSKDPEFNKLYKNLKNKRYVLAWTYLFLFLFIPLGIFIFQTSIIMMNSNSSNVINDVSSWNLILGGLDKNLTWKAFQYWRIITYVFVDNTTWIFLPINLIFGLIMFNHVKFSENVIKKYVIISTTFITSILSGLLISTSLEQTVTSGGIIPLCAVIGSSIVSAWKKSAASTVLKGKLLFPILFLFLWPILRSDVSLYINMLLSLSISICVTFLFTYNYKNISFDIIGPLIVILSSIIVPIVLLNLDGFVPPIDVQTIRTLIFYSGRLFTIEKANEYISNIGWKGILVSTENGIVFSRIW